MTNNTNAISAEKALLYLLGCAVNSLAPQCAVLSAMDWKEVYRLSQRHTVAAAACMAVEHGLAAATEPFVPDETQRAVLAHWKDAKNKAIRKNILMDAERGALEEFCERIGCWYLPLKGVVLQGRYPGVGMRQMADNDILYDPAFQQQICDWFLARGYTAESVGLDNHDVYHKEPLYNFELHTALFLDVYYPEWAAYYNNVSSRLLPGDRGRFGRRFREEDCYVYITLHEYKHFVGCGTGVRNLLDRYVFCANKAEALDWTYTRNELQALDIAEFEENARALSKALFADPTALLQTALSEKESELLAYYFASGTYGNMKTGVRHQLNAMKAQTEPISTKIKVQYLLRRLFPTREQMCVKYRSLARHSRLLPLYHLHRLLVKATKRRKNIRQEIKTLMKI